MPLRLLAIDKAIKLGLNRLEEQKLKWHLDPTENEIITTRYKSHHWIGAYSTKKAIIPPAMGNSEEFIESGHQDIKER